MSRAHRIDNLTARPLTALALRACAVLCLLSGAARAAPLFAFVDDPWFDLGNDLAGTHGSPKLEGQGLLVPGSKATLTLSNVLAQTKSFAVIGLSELNAPFKGGIMVPFPDLLFIMHTGGTSGSPSTVQFTGQVPLALPDDTDLFFQFWVIDPAGPLGYAASNALRGTTQLLYDVFSAEVDDRLEAAKRPAVSMPIYDVQDFSNQIYVRNADCWATSIDLTGLSPWNQYDGPRRAGTLISPRHVAFAKHYPLSTDPASNKLVFVTQNDVVVTRSVTAVAFPVGDIGIGVLDADVPPEIGFFKVLPRNWATHLPQVANLPMLHLDQEEKGLVRDLSSLSNTCNHHTPTDPLRLDFSEDLISGDSGNPGFLILGSEALFILTHYSSVHGPFYTAWFDEVNNAMIALGGGYTLTEFDLDGFLQN